MPAKNIQTISSCLSCQFSLFHYEVHSYFLLNCWRSTGSGEDREFFNLTPVFALVTLSANSGWFQGSAQVVQPRLAPVWQALGKGWGWGKQTAILPVFWGWKVLPHPVLCLDHSHFNVCG